MSRSTVVATEFVGTSVTSNGDEVVYGPLIPFNPHIRFFDGDRRGYVSCRLNRNRLKVDLQMVRTLSRPDAEKYTLASFVVEDGQPVAKRTS